MSEWADVLAKKGYCEAAINKADEALEMMSLQSIWISGKRDTLQTPIIPYLT